MVGDGFVLMVMVLGVDVDADVGDSDDGDDDVMAVFVLLNSPASATSKLTENERYDAIR